MKLVDLIRQWVKRPNGKPAKPPALQGVLTDAGGGIDLIWGAEWRPIPDALEARSAEEFGHRAARKHKAKSCAVVSNQRDAVVGLWRSESPKPPRTAFFAAQILGNLYSSNNIEYFGVRAEKPISNPYRQKERLIYVGRAGDRDDLFCLIAVVGGLPDVDFIGTPLEVEQCLYQQNDHLAEGAVLLLEDHPAVSEAYNHLVGAFLRTAEPVFGFPYGPDFRATVGAVHNVPLDKRKLALVLGSMGALALAGVWHLWGQQAEAALIQERRVAIKAKGEAARKSYLDARSIALASGPEFHAANASRKIWEYLSTVPMRRGGFALTSVACVGGECEFLYRREQKASTFADFVQTHRSGEHPEFDISKLDQGITRVTLSESSSWARINLSELQVQPDLLLRLGTVAQLLDVAGVKLLFTAPSPMVIEALEKGLPSVEAASLRRWQGTWSFEGPSDTVVPALSRLPMDMTLSRFELRVSKDHPKTPDMVVASGRYFATEPGGRK